MPSKCKPVKILMIAGNRWGLRELTPQLNKKFLKLMKETRKDITLRGFCDCTTRTLYYRPGQGKQDEQNTLLHEGLHALLWEIGCVHHLSHISTEEKTITTLTSELLSFCKQTSIMPA